MNVQYGASVRVRIITLESPCPKLVPDTWARSMAVTLFLIQVIYLNIFKVTYIFLTHLLGPLFTAVGWQWRN